MRIEVIASDGSLEANILASLADPQAYVLDLVRADRGVSAPNRTSGIPDYLAILCQADAAPGRFKTREEVDTHLNGLRAEW